MVIFSKYQDYGVFRSSVLVFLALVWNKLGGLI